MPCSLINPSRTVQKHMLQRGFIPDGSGCRKARQSQRFTHRNHCEHHQTKTHQRRAQALQQLETFQGKNEMKLQHKDTTSSAVWKGNATPWTTSPRLFSDLEQTWNWKLDHFEREKKVTFESKHLLWYHFSDGNTFMAQEVSTSAGSNLEKEEIWSLLMQRMCLHVYTVWCKRPLQAERSRCSQ